MDLSCVPLLGAGMLFFIVRLMHAHHLGLQGALGLMPRSVARSCLCRDVLKGCKLGIFKPLLGQTQRGRSQARTREGHGFPSLPSPEPEGLPLILSPCPAVAEGCFESTVQEQTVNEFRRSQIQQSMVQSIVQQFLIALSATNGPDIGQMLFLLQAETAGTSGAWELDKSLLKLLGMKLFKQCC